MPSIKVRQGDKEEEKKKFMVYKKQNIIGITLISISTINENFLKTINKKAKTPKLIKNKI